MDRDLDQERFLHGGLLASKGQWILPLGVTQAPFLRHGAQVVLGLVFGLMACWLLTLGNEALAGQGDWPTVALACGFGLAWTSMAWRLFQTLQQAGTVILRWGGLPPFKVLSRPVPDNLPGWSLPESQLPVAVHVVFDLGTWLLVKICPIDGSGDAPEAWSWLDTRVHLRGERGHQLRTLLFSRKANQAGVPKADGAVDQATVASSKGLQRQWPHLLSSLKKPVQAAGQNARPTRAGRQGLAMGEKVAFADTLIDEQRARA